MQLERGKKAFRLSQSLLLRLCLVFVFAFSLSPSEAQEGGKKKRAEVSLLSTVEGVGDSETVTLGLRFKLQEGWHTYWRSPGPGSYPVKLDFKGSENIASHTLYWPEPERFKVLGVASIGYSGEVTLPLVITLKQKGAPLKINLFADYLVCTASTCIPEEARLSFELGAGPAHVTPQAREIAAFTRKVPDLNASPKLTIERQALVDETVKPGLRLRVKATHEDAFTAPKAFLEGPVDFYGEAPEVNLSSSGKEATFIFDAYRNEKQDAPPPEAFQKGPLTFSLFDGEEGAHSILTATLPGMTVTFLLTILGAALLGGFILNFMPCVLPVLSLKIFAVLKSEKESLKEIRLEFLLTTAGILASFLLLGAGAALLKSYGVVVGWGMQFQQPLFLLGISLILILFTANLWGFFEVSAPHGLINKIVPFLNLEGRVQHFFMGAFVTLLATPCTAPFLATAISFSLSRGAVEILSIFMVMGAGLAIPYILIGLFPKAAYVFPKPGPWMTTLRKVLGLLVFLTLLWILRVLYAQVNPSASLMIFTLIALIFVALLLLSKTQKRQFRRVGWVVVVLLGAGLFFVPYEAAREIKKAGGFWQPFERHKIADLVKEGRVVFVDVTADWCLTCKANELLVLHTPKTAERFKVNNVVPMRADWTSPEPEITDFMKSFGEYGIPLYVVFGPGKPQGIKLPQILTHALIQEAIDTVKAK